mmetsp:Transcript_23707/g.59167  ORF Transcript_23707/g.59167 Transcript_23707/m.59167 type:complete len:260 (+) Transcript_23707:242-1021(+)
MERIVADRPASPRVHRKFTSQRNSGPRTSSAPTVLNKLIGALRCWLQTCPRQENCDRICDSPDEQTDRPPLHLPHLGPLYEPLHKRGKGSIDYKPVEAERAIIAAQTHDVDKRHDRCSSKIFRISQQRLAPRMPQNILRCHGSVHLCVVGLLDLTRRVCHDIADCEGARSSFNPQVVINPHLLPRPEAAMHVATRNALRVAAHPKAHEYNVCLDHLAVFGGAAAIIPLFQWLTQEQLHASVSEPPLHMLCRLPWEQGHQ